MRGLDLVELPQADACCGFGSTFALKNADTSTAMLTDKVRHVLSTGAEVWWAWSWACCVVAACVAAVGLAGAGVLVWLWRAPPKFGQRLHSFTAPVVAWFALDTIDWHKLGQIGAYFAYAGSFVFGSGLAIVPFLYGGVVTEHHWLNEKQFVDAVAVAMITPGPVVITVGLFHAGSKGNVIPDDAVFEATLRTFQPATADRVVSASIRLCEQIAAAQGCVLRPPSAATTR